MRDDTKNGCVADYKLCGIFFTLLFGTVLDSALCRSIIAQGRPDADWEAQSEANTLCKIIWDALVVCIFL